MKNSNLFIHVTCLIPALLLAGMVNLKAQNELSGYTYMGQLEDYYSGGGYHHYYLSNCETTWEEANAAAIEMGGYLAIINHEGEQFTLGDWYYYYSGHSNEGAWIGLRGENGIYEWIPEQSTDGGYYFLFPEPVYADGAALIGGQLRQYNWTTYPVTGEAKYIVEFPFQPNCNSNNPDKVYVCHNGNTICVNVTALQGHLDHGDLEGPCGPCNTYAMQAFPDETLETDDNTHQHAKEVHSKPEEHLEVVNVITPSNQIHIFPNPASEEIQVLLPEVNQVGILRILSLTGQEIHVLQLSGQQSFSLDLSSYASGVYLIEVQSVNGHFKKKIVKL